MFIPIFVLTFISTLLFTFLFLFICSFIALFIFVFAFMFKGLYICISICRFAYLHISVFYTPAYMFIFMMVNVIEPTEGTRSLNCGLGCQVP